MYGGDEEIRTPDPLLARQVLSQLSYTPTFLLQLSHDHCVVVRRSLSCVLSTRLRSLLTRLVLARNLCKNNHIGLFILYDSKSYKRE